MKLADRILNTNDCKVNLRPFNTTCYTMYSNFVSAKKVDLVTLPELFHRFADLLLTNRAIIIVRILFIKNSRSTVEFRQALIELL